LVSYNGGLQINSAEVAAFLENRPLSVNKTQTRRAGSSFRHQMAAEPKDA
jgi:hypothetical protein